MRKTIAWSGLAVVAGLILVSAAPAQAAVVTTDVPADTIVNLDPTTFAAPLVYTPWALAGPAVYPLTATITPGAGFGFVASGFTLSPAAVGCTRLVNALTYGFTVTPFPGGAGTLSQLAVSVGVPAEFVDSALDYAGDGTATMQPGSGTSQVANIVLSNDGDAPQSGSLTLTLATPAAAEDTVIVPIGFTTQAGQPFDVTVNDFTFSVTDTCPDAVVAAAPALAATGFDATPLVGGALGSLLVGAAFVTLGLRRRSVGARA